MSKAVKTMVTDDLRARYREVRSACVVDLTVLLIAGSVLDTHARPIAGSQGDSYADASINTDGVRVADRQTRLK